MNQFTFKGITYSEDEEVIVSLRTYDDVCATIKDIMIDSHGYTKFWLASDSDQLSGENKRFSPFEFSWVCKIKDDIDRGGDLPKFRKKENSNPDIFFNVFN